MIRRIIFIKLDRTARDLTGFRKWPPIYLDLPCIRLDLSYVGLRQYIVTVSCLRYFAQQIIKTICYDLSYVDPISLQI